MIRAVLFQIKTPQKVVYEGAVKSIRLPSMEGIIQILEGHTPLITVLKEGVIEIEDGPSFKIKGGYAYIQSKNWSVYTPYE